MPILIKNVHSFPISKYRSKPSQWEGIKFHSKLERDYFIFLTHRKKKGEIIFFLRQIPFDLPGKTKYYVDYQVLEKDGTLRFIDIKGVETDTFKIKKRMVEEIYYPIHIEIIKKGNFK
ncbi:DUF1064 domain-containing protein [Flavobacterium sp.]|uniref:DUF1064 domain-containing protein n=1 Tax=Flavobacterium sp. TaxID=239 RepID=UPI003F6A395D